MQIIRFDENEVHKEGPINLPYSCTSAGTRPGNICTPELVLEILQSHGWVIYEGDPVYSPDTQRLGEYYLDAGAGKRRVDEIPYDEQAAILLAEQESVWVMIRAERERRTLNGGYSAVGKWFHSDLISRGQQTGLVIMGASIPAGLQWKTMDGTFVAMTPQVAGAVFAAAAAQDAATFQAAEVHRAAMQLVSHPFSYDFTGGWPAVYVAAV